MEEGSYKSQTTAPKADLTREERMNAWNSSLRGSTTAWNNAELLKQKEKTEYNK